MTYDYTTWRLAGGAEFRFQHSRLVGLVLGADDAGMPDSVRPAIGEEGGARLFVMPAGQEDLVHLLGPAVSKWEYWNGGPSCRSTTTVPQQPGEPRSRQRDARNDSSAAFHAAGSSKYGECPLPGITTTFAPVI